MHLVRATAPSSASSNSNASFEDDETPRCPLSLLRPPFSLTPFFPFYLGTQGTTKPTTARNSAGVSLLFSFSVYISREERNSWMSRAYRLGAERNAKPLCIIVYYTLTNDGACTVSRRISKVLRYFYDASCLLKCLFFCGFFSPRFLFCINNVIIGSVR